VELDGQLWIHDADTVRRLVRLEAIDASDTYPVVEPMDGFPKGTVIHWTLPMDWALRTLNPIGKWFYPNARGYEAGAIIAGPALGLAAVLLMIVAGVRLFGAFAGLAIATFYAFAYGGVQSSRLGVGDHQTLQQLALLGTALAFIAFLKRRSTGLATWLAGALLGLAVWVSTESMLFVYLWSFVAVLHMLLAEDERTAWRQQLQASIGFVVVVAIGHLVEQRHALLAFELDKISTLQLYQAAVLLVFVSLVRALPLRSRGQRVFTAAGCATALGLALLPKALDQFEAFAEINVWLQEEIVEFQGLFTGLGPFVGLTKAIGTESPLLLALPLFVFGLLVNKRMTHDLRITLAVMTVATFALEAWEVKLAHFFSIFFPIVMVCGSQPLFDRIAGRFGQAKAKLAAVTGAVVLVVCALMSMPAPYSQGSGPMIERGWRQVCNRLAVHSGGNKDGAVLAPWDRGAHIMYYAGLPVLASGYHRNIDGILAGNRVYLSTKAKRAEVMRVLRERRVRWIVADYQMLFLLTAPKTLGRPALAHWQPGGLTFHEEAGHTFFWELRYAQQVPGLRLVEEGPAIELQGVPQSLFRLYELR
jgi:hypothetical protein